MSWYSTGAEAADVVAASMVTKRRRNFYTKAGERAVIRFLSPATESFNYKRCFVAHAKGEKMLTSPQTIPDPFEAAGLKLQAAFGWLVIDRRILEFKDDQGEDKKVGPRVLYFADGQRTRKQLIAFEKDQLANMNEERAEDGKEPLTLAEYNLTSYDISVSKDKGAPWNFSAKRPKALSKDDRELIEKNEFVLHEELAPLPVAEIAAIVGGKQVEAEEVTGETKYSYGGDEDDDDDTIDFD